MHTLQRAGLRGYCPDELQFTANPSLSRNPTGDRFRPLPATFSGIVGIFGAFGLAQVGSGAPGFLAMDTVTYSSIGNPRLGLAGTAGGAIGLGGVLVLAGVFILADVVVARPSTLLFGLALLAAGAFQVVHTLRAPQVGAFLLRLLLGAFYVISGGMLTAHPLASSRVQTFAFA